MSPTHRSPPPPGAIVYDAGVLSKVMNSVL